MLVAALLVEALAGYPDSLFRRAGHPVSWIGWLIGRLDARWNDPEQAEAVRRWRGMAALGCCLGTAWSAGALAARSGRAGVVLAASSLLAGRSLHVHVAAVADGLHEGLGAGREALSRIVGRDTAGLDEAGVARAAIESLAENFSDGVVAPALWFALGGLPAMAAYKAVNTADSMVGHRGARYGAFGWASARLDDVVNLPASRLSALLIAAASGRFTQAMQAVRRDAVRHRSPNAGWPEAAMAGALGVRLAGPRSYGGVVVDDAWMGDGGEPSPEDIGRALAIYRRAWLLGLAFVVGAISLGLRFKPHQTRGVWISGLVVRGSGAAGPSGAWGSAPAIPVVPRRPSS